MKAQSSTGGDQQSSDEQRRKPYESPRLELYGDLLEISKSVREGGKNDGAGHPNKHFTS